MFVKICGMTRQQDLDAAAQAGAACCGFIFHGKSPRNITPEHARALDSRGMHRVGVFVKQDCGEIAGIAETARLDLLQLHGGQTTADADALGRQRVIRVLWPDRFAGDAGALQAEIDRWAPHCALYLLDAGTAGGGSGTKLDLAMPARVRFPHPWLLAGGLGAGSMTAFRILPEDRRPCGLDLNSGVEERPGCKDAGKIRAAFAQLQACGYTVHALPAGLLPAGPADPGD